MGPAAALRETVLVPAAVVLVFALVGLALSRRAPRARDAVRTLGIAAAFCAGLWTQSVRPGLPLAPSEDAWTWVFWLAPFGAGLGVAETLAPGRDTWRRPLRVAAGAVAAWLVHRPFVPHAVSTVEALVRCLGAGVVTALVWGAIGRGASRGGRLATALPPVIAAAAAAAITLELASAAVLALALGTLASSTATTALFSERAPKPLLPAAAGGAFAVPFVVLLLAAHPDLSYGSRVTILPAACLAGSATCAAIRRPWVASCTAAALAVGAAICATLA